MATTKWPKNKLVVDTVKLKWKIKNIRDPSVHNSPYFESPLKKMKFRLFFELVQNKTRVLLRCINADDFDRDKFTFRYHIGLYSEGTGQLFLDRVMQCKLGKNKYYAYCSFDMCKRYLTNNNLRVICSVKIIEEIPDVKVEDLMDLSDSFGSLLTSGTLSDMTLSVVGGKDFPVHKNILAARSPVFGAMFEHKDSREMQEGRISIEDMSSDVCEVMLRHIYTGQVPTNMSDYAFDLYVAADKYQLTKLKSICEEALSKLLDLDTVCSVLLIADGCNASKLKLKCIEFITDNSVDVMKSEGWKQIAAKNELLVELFGHLSKKSQPYLGCNKKLKVNHTSPPGSSFHSRLTTLFNA